MQLTTMTYAVTGKIARITLNRPERSNALSFETPRELAACVERANLAPAIHVIAPARPGAGRHAPNPPPGAPGDRPRRRRRGVLRRLRPADRRRGHDAVRRRRD